MRWRCRVGEVGQVLKIRKYRDRTFLVCPDIKAKIRLRQGTQFELSNLNRALKTLGGFTKSRVRVIYVEFGPEKFLIFDDELHGRKMLLRRLSKRVDITINLIPDFAIEMLPVETAAMETVKV